MTLRSALRRLCRGTFALGRNVRGATAVEYGLIVTLIVIAMIAALKGVAEANTSLWGNVSTKVQSAN
jgi:pilus assembly protein Flp/PilA